MSVEEYLQTSFEDGDLEYVDGELLDTNAGEIDHSVVQTLLCGWFLARRKLLGVFPLAEVRVKVSPTRYRLPDVTVVLEPKPEGRIITEPPFLVIEVLSPEDRASRTEKRIDDYLRFGIHFIWMIDPKSGNGHIYSADRRIPVEDGVFCTDGPRIELKFADLFE